MLSSLHKSKQISFMVMDRLSDYLSLARIELQLQGRELMMQALTYSAAALFFFLIVLFFGFAIFINFLDTPHCTLPFLGVGFFSRFFCVWRLEKGGW